MALRGDSGIFKSGNPRKRAAVIVQAVTNYKDAKLLAELSEDLGEAMVSDRYDIALIVSLLVELKIVHCMYFCCNERFLLVNETLFIVCVMSLMYFCGKNLKQ